MKEALKSLLVDKRKPSHKERKRERVDQILENRIIKIT